MSLDTAYRTMSTSIDLVSPTGEVQAAFPCSVDPYAVDRACWDEAGVPCANKEIAMSIIVLGASGDLAKKKTFPAIAALHARKGYAFS